MTYLHVGSRVPVLFMRINVAKEDGYLCRILAVEVRRVKCVFPRNKVQKEMIIIATALHMCTCARSITLTALIYFQKALLFLEFLLHIV